jgi:hypothetical protein
MTRHAFIKPHSVTCALAELLATRCRQERRCESHGPLRHVILIAFLILFEELIHLLHPRDVFLCRQFDRFRTLKNIAELICTTNLDLRTGLEHLPPIPSLHKWIGEFSKTHAITVFESVLDTVPSKHGTHANIPSHCDHHLPPGQSLIPGRVIDQRSSPCPLVRPPSPPRIALHQLPKSLELCVHDRNIRIVLDLAHGGSSAESTFWVSDPASRASEKKSYTVAMNIHPGECHERDHVPDM